MKMDEMTLELESPITEEQWDKIADVDFDHTDRIYFHTKHGKEVEFVKRKKGRWIPCSERLPEESGRYLVTRGLNACGSLWNRIYIANYSDLMGIKSEKIWWQGNVGKSDFERIDDVIAWMPLPEPYREGD